MSSEGAEGEVQRQRDHRHDFPPLLRDDAHAPDGHACADEVARTAAHDASRPRSVNRLPGDKRHDDLCRRTLDDAVSENRERDRQALVRPLEGEECAAGCLMHPARGLHRGDDGKEVDDAAADAMRMFRIGQALREGAGNRDRARRVRTKYQQCCEVDDEGRRHDRPVPCARPLSRERRDQRRSQHQGRELKNALRLRPPSQRQKSSDSRRDRGDSQHVRTLESRRHSQPSTGALLGAILSYEQDANQQELIRTNRYYRAV